MKTKKQLTEHDILQAAFICGGPMPTDLPADFLAMVWGLSKRSVQRWLTHPEHPAPLSHWFDMPEWREALPDVVGCKLTENFERRIDLYSDIKYRPKPFTNGAQMWFDGAEGAKKRGKEVRWPDSLNPMLKK